MSYHFNKTIEFLALINFDPGQCQTAGSGGAEVDNKALSRGSGQRSRRENKTI